MYLYSVTQTQVFQLDTCNSTHRLTYHCLNSSDCSEQCSLADNDGAQLLRSCEGEGNGLVLNELCYSIPRAPSVPNAIPVLPPISSPISSPVSDPPHQAVPTSGPPMAQTPSSPSAVPPLAALPPQNVPIGTTPSPGARAPSSLAPSSASRGVSSAAALVTLAAGLSLLL